MSPRLKAFEAMRQTAAQGVSAMGSWAKCSDHEGRTLWVNLDNVTTIMWRNVPQEGTEIVFIGGGQVIAREPPEKLLKQSEGDGHSRAG
jgi:hypothetical protein